MLTSIMTILGWILVVLTCWAVYVTLGVMHAAQVILDGKFTPSPALSRTDAILVARIGTHWGLSRRAHCMVVWLSESQEQARANRIYGTLWDLLFWPYFAWALNYEHAWIEAHSGMCKGCLNRRCLRTHPSPECQD